MTYFFLILAIGLAAYGTSRFLLYTGGVIIPTRSDRVSMSKQTALSKDTALSKSDAL